MSKKIIYNEIKANAILNPDDSDIIFLNKTKIVKGVEKKTEVRSVIITETGLKWVSGWGQRFRKFIGTRKAKDINFEDMVIRPLSSTIEDEDNFFSLENYFYFTISKKGSEDELYKFTPILNDNIEIWRHRNYNIRHFYRTLIKLYNNYHRNQLNIPQDFHSRTNSEDDQVRDLELYDYSKEVELSFNKKTLELTISAPIDKTFKVDYIYPIIHKSVKRPYNFVILTEDNDIYDIGFRKGDLMDNILYNFVFMVNNFSIMNIDNVFPESARKTELFRYGYYGGEDCSNYYINIIIN